MNRHKLVGVVAAASLMAATAVPQVEIVAFQHNGRLVASNLVAGSTATVEWASSMAGPWTNSWSGLDSAVADSNGVLGVAVPMFYRVSGHAFDHAAPSGMVLIPAGSFQMGNAMSATGDGAGNELPVHSVYVSAFYMDKYEVTNDKMVEVLNWAYGQGKLIVTSATVKNAEGNQQELLDLDDADCRIQWNGSQFVLKAAKGSGYPCVVVTWYGAVAYCNYRTLKEGGGRTPCYSFSDWTCNWSANGYRLPTEAEWEKAARGGASGRRFPWNDSDNIQHTRANYYSTTSYSYDTSGTRGYHPTYNDGVSPYTSPVGSFAPNGYGLYDMAGNVWEWCWDWYAPSYFGTSPGSDPRGAVTGSSRVVRGGSWYRNADGCRVAIRGGNDPVDVYDRLGFRAVLPPGQQ